MKKKLLTLWILALWLPLRAVAFECAETLFKTETMAPEVADALERFTATVHSFRPDANVDTIFEVGIEGRSPQEIEAAIGDGQENYFSPTGQTHVHPDGFSQEYAATDGEWKKTVKVTTHDAEGRPIAPYLQIFYQDRHGGVIRLKPNGSPGAPAHLVHLRQPHGAQYFKVDPAGDLSYANEAFKVHALRAYPKSPAEVQLPEGVGSDTPEAEGYLRRCWTFRTHVPLADGIRLSRTILYPAEPSGELKAIAERIADLATPKVPYVELQRQGDYLVRIAPRQHVLSDANPLLDNAIIGTKPYVFVTTPESLYGKSLLDVYLDIGYESEDIIRWQRDQAMVAIVFRYPDEIRFSDVTDGRLSGDWRTQVYVPTWENVFVIFEELTREASVEPDKKSEFAPEKLFFHSAAERGFVLGFPQDAKQRLMSVSYIGLKATGGADWSYRQLLERKLSIFEHFRGNGRTLNELVDPNGTEPQAGLLEFVGPNVKLKTLPEVAVIDLGTLRIDGSYSAGLQAVGQ